MPLPLVAIGKNATPTTVVKMPSLQTAKKDHLCNAVYYAKG